jgi:AhpD family alkylhydroperoxidase
MSQRALYDTTSAAGMKAFGGVYLYVAHCGLEKSLVDLVYLRASQINGCAYCIDAHTHDLLKEGVSIEKVVLVSAWREAGPCFSDREQAALAWAEAVTNVSSTHVPDADYDAAVAIFGEKALADLTIAIGLINAYNRMAISFRKIPESVRASFRGPAA